MPEAVIVDAVRTPIGRAMKGTLRDVRADDLAAVPLRALVERNPGVDFARDERHHDGLRVPGGRAGLQRRPQRAVVGGDRSSRAGGDGQPVLRVVVADDPDGLSCGEGRARAISTSRPGVECVSRGAAQTFPLMNHRIDGTQRHGLQRLHLDGDHGRERRRALQGRRVSPRMSGRRCRSSGRWRPATAAISTARSSASRSPRLHDAGGDVIAAHTVAARRRAAARHHGGEARRAQAGVQARRLGDGRQRLPAQRRRRRRAGDVRGQSPRAGPHAAGADHRVLGRRGAPGDHGPRSDPRDQSRARAGRHEHRGHRRGRDERGVRRPGRALPRRARHRPREAQHLRRRDRARATRSG